MILIDFIWSSYLCRASQRVLKRRKTSAGPRATELAREVMQLQWPEKTSTSLLRHGNRADM